MKRPHCIAVAIFDTHCEALEAVRQLQRGGFDMSKISMVGRGCDTSEDRADSAEAPVHFSAKPESFWASLGETLFGTAFLVSPVLGHLVVLGPLASAAASAGRALVGGSLSALAGALSALGISRQCVLHYQTALEADKYLLVVHGEAHLQQRASDLLARANGLEPAARVARRSQRRSW